MHISDLDSVGTSWPAARSKSPRVSPRNNVPVWVPPGASPLILVPYASRYSIVVGARPMSSAPVD